jgi:2-dehydro-3-deoxy-D-gluconate 5-dehydrogenase
MTASSTTAAGSTPTRLPRAASSRRAPRASVSQEALQQFAQLIPLKRLGMPGDIARTVLFLASDPASYMTGAQIVVDGGRLLA